MLSTFLYLLLMLYCYSNNNYCLLMAAPHGRMALFSRSTWLCLLMIMRFHSQLAWNTYLLVRQLTTVCEACRQASDALARLTDALGCLSVAWRDALQAVVNCLSRSIKQIASAWQKQWCSSVGSTQCLKIIFSDFYRCWKWKKQFLRYLTNGRLLWKVSNWTKKICSGWTL